MNMRVLIENYPFVAFNVLGSLFLVRAMNMDVKRGQ